MDSITLRAKKDYFKYSNRPKLEDIFTVKGFLRYFVYRTSAPFIRDLIFILVDTFEIYLLFYLYGRSVSTAGIMAYVINIIGINIWQLTIYSIREKILEKQKQAKNFHISLYLFSYFIISLFLWLSSFILAISLLKFSSPNARLIFINKTISNLFTFVSIAYFFTAYTFSRIYIPFFATVLTKLSGIIFILLTYKIIGLYSFIIGFYLDKTLSLYVMIKFINRNYRKKRINPFSPIPSIKNMVKYLRELSITKTLLRAVSFSVYNLQSFLIILFVKKYFIAYLFEFFLFFQLLRFLLLPAKRIGKSLFYDLTKLTVKRDFNTQNRLLKMNFIALIIVSSFTTGIFYVMLDYALYPRHFWKLFFEFYMFGYNKYLLLFVFFTSLVVVLKKILLTLEVHLLLILSILSIELGIVFYFLQIKGLAFIHKTPMMFFVIAGYFYVWYSLLLVGIYISNVWKRFSYIYKISNIRPRLQFSSRALFFNSIKQDFFIVVLNSSSKHTLEKIYKLLKNRYNDIIVSRFTRYSLCIYRNNLTQAQLSVILVPFIKKIYYIKKSNDYNKIKHLLIPSLTSTKVYTENTLDYLKINNIKYTYHRVKVKDYVKLYFSKTQRKLALIELANYMYKNDFIIPEILIFKEEFLGLVPLFEGDNYRLARLVGFVELCDINLSLVQKILRKQL